MGSSQSLMTGLKQDREENVPECLGRYFSWIFTGNIQFLVNGIQECRLLMVLEGIWELCGILGFSWYLQNIRSEQNSVYLYVLLCLQGLSQILNFFKQVKKKFPRTDLQFLDGLNFIKAILFYYKGFLCLTLLKGQRP